MSGVCSILELMKRTVTNAVWLAVILSSCAAYAAEKQFAPGRIVTVEKKFHERVLYYLVNTPITQDDPYYELSLQLGTVLYLTEYTPRHAADELPDGWKDDANVLIKITDKRHVLVKQEGGTELQLLVLKRTPAATQPTSPKSAPPAN